MSLIIGYEINVEIDISDKTKESLVSYIEVSPFGYAIFFLSVVYRSCVSIDINLTFL